MELSPSLRNVKKKPKTSQSDGDGTPDTVTKNKASAVTSKDPPKIPTLSYCYLCGDSDHTSKTCKETGDLKCDNHVDIKSHKKCAIACNIYLKANNLTVHP